MRHIVPFLVAAGATVLGVYVYANYVASSSTLK